MPAYVASANLLNYAELEMAASAIGGVAVDGANVPEKASFAKDPWYINENKIVNGVSAVDIPGPFGYGKAIKIQASAYDGETNGTATFLQRFGTNPTEVPIKNVDFGDNDWPRDDVSSIASVYVFAQSTASTFQLTQHSTTDTKTGNYAVFKMASGVIIGDPATDSSGGTTAGYEYVGGGWYRCWLISGGNRRAMYGVHEGNDRDFRIHLYSWHDLASEQDAVRYLIIWGPQVEDFNQLGDYAYSVGPGPLHLYHTNQYLGFTTDG